MVSNMQKPTFDSYCIMYYYFQVSCCKKLLVFQIFCELKSRPLIKYVCYSGAPAEVLPDYEEMLTSFQLGGEGGEEGTKPPTTTRSTPPGTAAATDTEEEMQETGSVAWRVYLVYLRAVGLTLTVFILIAITFMQVTTLH